MTAEKWKLVRGSVYKLAEVFEGMTDAVTLAREMKEKHVFLSKMDGGQSIGESKNLPLNTNRNITTEYNPIYWCLIASDNI
ncbi:MAG: hypothetical protein ACTSWA_10365 [Candidatus Thorarchaeota archaeon]